MAAVVHLTSILLGCWISKVTYAAALPNDKMSSEAWPVWPFQAAQNWRHPAPRAWEPYRAVKVPGTKQFYPTLHLNQNGGTNAAQGKVSPVKPKVNTLVAKPRTLEIKFQAPMLNTEDKSDHDHSHDYSHFHQGSQMESPSRVSSHTDRFNKDPQGSSKPGFHFSLSVPLPKTTAAPKPPDRKDARFYNTGPSQSSHYPHHMPEVNKPGYHRPIAQKPESKIVTFLSGLFNQKNDQTNTQSQQNQGIFKPVAHQQPSAHTGSANHQNPTNYWTGQMHASTSNDAGSAVQRPSHQAAQNVVHYSPQWYPVPQQTDVTEVKNSILQSATYVNGQIMIPLEKCPGFEKFAAIFQNLHHHDLHHQHGQGHQPHHGQGHQPHHGQGHQPHHGQVHQPHHGQVHQPHHGQVHQPHHGQVHQPHHGQVHQPHHGQVHQPHHGHHHQHHHGQVHQHGHSLPDGPIQTKPHYTKVYVNVEGVAPNPNEPTQGTNVQQSGPYHDGPFRRWPGAAVNPPPGNQNSRTDDLHYTYSQQPIMQPGQTNYAVELGANVGYDISPDTQTQNNYRANYAVPRRDHY